MWALLFAAIGCTAGLGAIALFLTQKQRNTLRLTFRDAESETLWRALTGKRPRLLLISSTTIEARSQTLRNITRYYRFHEPYAFLHTRNLHESLSKREVQVWIGATEHGDLVYAASGSNRSGLIAAFIAERLHATAIYISLPASPPQLPVFAQFVRCTLGLPAEAAYEVQWLLRWPGRHRGINVHLMRTGGL